jgi:hypothetical protein
MVPSRVARALSLACLAATLAACKGGESSAPEQQIPLNFQEEQAVGLWSRFHAFDGSTDYILLRADRTACDWEEASGSSSKVSYDEWTWSISGSATSHPYTIVTAGAGINYVFDYPAGEMWPQSFSTLVFSKSGSSRTCQ